MENNKRNIGLDLLKCLAIIFVIARHIPLYEEVVSIDSNKSIYIQLFFSLVSTGVPIFFVVNGYLLLRKEKLDLNKHINKTIKIFLLTLIWALILIIINLFFDKTPLDRSQIIDLFLHTQSGALYVGELWFLEALCAIYLIFPLLHNVYHNNYKIFLYFFVILLLFTCGIYLIEILTSLITNPIHANHFNNFMDLLNRFGIIDSYKWWLMYFMLGGFINKYIDKLEKKKIIIFILSIIMWIISFVYCLLLIKKNGNISKFNIDKSVFEIVIVVGLFMLFKNTNANNKVIKIIGKIGTDTFGIYVTHYYFIRIARLLIPSTFFYQRLLILIISLILSYIFTLIVKKIPLINNLLKI